MTERLKAEQTARDESLSELSQALRETIKSFEKKAVQLDEQTSRAQRELRQQIVEQSKTLCDEFLEKSRELSESFGRAVAELRLEKTDRHALAALLTEVATRLNNELTLPGMEPALPPSIWPKTFSNECGKPLVTCRWSCCSTNRP